MPSFLEITPEKLNRIVGTPNASVIVDVRNDENFAADPRLLPGSIRRDYRAVADWAERLAGPSVVLCQKGQKFSHGVAAHLRALGKAAEVLEGGFEAWRPSKATLVPEEKLPPRDNRGRTVWVTRARPKIDRIACPWLIRRFVDPSAVFLFVPAAEVSAVADRFNAAPFDIDEAYWSHRGELCTFDVMVEEFGLGTDPMLRLATIVREPTRRDPILPPKCRDCLPPRSVCRACSTTTSSSSRRA